MENEENISTNTSPKLIITNVAGWIFGIILLIMTIGVFQKSAPGGFAMLFGGLILIPPVNKIITDKLNFNLSGRWRAIVAIVLFGIGLSTLPPVTKSATVPVSEETSNETANQNQQPAPKTETTQSNQDNEVASAPASDVIFDIPSLLHKNIDEITNMLGTPKDNAELTELQMKSGNDQWGKEYEKGGYTLMVTYHVKDRSVIDFFVSATDDIYEKRDKEKMFKLTNTNESDGRYSVSFVPAYKDATRFTGISIKTK